MARKREEKPDMPAAVEAKLKPVRLDLTPDAHDLLRVVAAYEKTSMASYAREVLEEHLKAEAKRRGIRS